MQKTKLIIGLASFCFCLVILFKSLKSDRFRLDKLHNSPLLEDVSTKVSEILKLNYASNILDTTLNIYEIHVKTIKSKSSSRYVLKFHKALMAKTLIDDFVESQINSVIMLSNIYLIDSIDEVATHYIMNISKKSTISNDNLTNENSKLVDGRIIHMIGSLYVYGKESDR